MNTSNEKAASGPRFHNSLYRAAVTRNSTSLILTFEATNPEGRFGRPRQITALVYEIAAQLERRSDEIEAAWRVLPDTFRERITIEFSDNEEVERARANAIVAEVIAENHLAAEETKR